VLRRGARIAGLLGLIALSLAVRSRSLDGSLWIDEGISRGIAVHGVTEIPGLLRQDGSPPLYYILLHAWTIAFGDGETALRSLSLLAALLTIPAALWAGTAVAGRTAGWLAAVLAALNPFLTVYAQEARMYALVALLSVVACGAFARGFVDGSGRHRALFAVTLAALLWTHAWAIFLALGFAAAAAFHLRGRWREAALPFAAAALLFAPWLPTLVDQAQHTGAPWSKTPSLGSLLGGIPGALDGGGGAAAVIAVGAVGAIRLRRDPRAARIALLLLLAGLVALAAAWVHSNVTPSWANRYLAILVGPVTLAAAAGLARAGRLGIVTTAAVATVWLFYAVPDDRSNVRALVAAAKLPPETTVVSTQPEQVPLLAYYLGQEHRYVTPLGPVADPLVMNWRDALERLRTAREPELDAARVVLVVPLGGERGWDAAWQREVLRVSELWQAALLGEQRYRVARTVDVPRAERSRTDLRLLVFLRL
jgi:mannosyltransferase